MATYKPYRKTDKAGTLEEIKIPYSSIDGTPTRPTVNDGTLTIQKNGKTVGTFTANQKDGTTANITVPTKASDVNALSLDGGTINKSKTVKMDASANSDGANLKWGTVNSKNPYIGYASDQVDGTFVVGSLLGTNYASGLAIGGGSGNLLWKGTKVATTNDIPNVSGKANLSGGNTFSGRQSIAIDNAGYVFDVMTDSQDCGTVLGVEKIDGGYGGASRIIVDGDGLGNVELNIDSNAGTAGQVLTSQGAGATPQWKSMPTYSLSGTTLTITLP